MLKDITIGQYYPGDSFLHRLDPRTKILGLILYMIGLFLVENFFGYTYVFAFTALVIGFSGIPLKILLKGVRSLWFLILLTLVLNFFLFSEGTVIWQFWIFKLTKEGIYKGFFMALRLILLVNITSLLTLTTSPIVMTDGLEKLMRRIHLPMAHELAMMMTIALRFIPTLIDETDKIMKAQSSRGADFEGGNLLKKAKGLVPLLVPLFISAFRRADDLAMAMEARCYRGGEGRTRLKEIAYTGKDALAYCICFIFLAIAVIDRVL